MKVRSSCVTRALAAQLQKLLGSCLEPGNWESLELGAGKTQESEIRERKEDSLSRQGKLLCSRKQGLREAAAHDAYGGRGGSQERVKPAEQPR